MTSKQVIICDHCKKEKDATKPWPWYRLTFDTTKGTGYDLCGSECVIAFVASFLAPFYRVSMTEEGDGYRVSITERDTENE